MSVEPPFSEACERNKAPILEVLREEFPAQGRVLEIGSGTGQHVVHFASGLPGLLWQPSEHASELDGLISRIRLEGPDNIAEPLELDVLADWPEETYDAALSANTAHIMSWEAVCAMFAGLGSHLCNGATFCLYGPFNEGGRYTAPSNESFDHWLQSRDPAMGLRDIEALEGLGMHHGLHLEKRHTMPANNQVLVFRRTGPGQV